MFLGALTPEEVGQSACSINKSMSLLDALRMFLKQSLSKLDFLMRVLLHWRHAVVFTFW